MIPRYSRKEMTSIWEEENKFNIWVDIEVAALEAMEKLKIVPEGTSVQVKEKASFDINRIDEHWEEWVPKTKLEEILKKNIDLMHNNFIANK